uniref:Uncharacterized protein n=1 Tax=Glycine max TaxID=3847 RepID=C6TLS8_SOYBN|nr:unknown [Glycine max]
MVSLTELSGHPALRLMHLARRQAQVLVKNIWNTHYIVTNMAESKCFSCNICFFNFWSLYNNIWIVRTCWLDIDCLFRSE